MSKSRQRRRSRRYRRPFRGGAERPPLGRFCRLPRRRSRQRKPHAAHRGQLPQAAQHLPLPAWATCGFNLQSTRCLMKTCSCSTSTCSPAPASWWWCAAARTARAAGMVTSSSTASTMPSTTLRDVDLSALYPTCSKIACTPSRRRVSPAAPRKPSSTKLPKPLCASWPRSSASQPTKFWSYLPADASRAASVHLGVFPKPNELVLKTLHFLPTGKKLLQVRDEALKKSLKKRRKREADRQSPGSAKCNQANDDVAATLKNFKSSLKELLNVSQVEVKENSSNGTVQAITLPADGTKCERCWNYYADEAAWTTSNPSAHGRKSADVAPPLWNKWATTANICNYAASPR